MISAKVDGIAVSPSNAPAMAKVLERAKAAGIPVTTWDSDLLPKDKGLRATYVGTKNYDIGVNLAKIVMKLKPKGGTICIQSGGAAAANHNERMQGIRDTISGKKSKEPPGDRLTGQNGWKEVDGCPLYTNDDFPLAVHADGRNPREVSGPDRVRTDRRLPAIRAAAVQAGGREEHGPHQEQEDDPGGGRHAADADGSAEGRLQHGQVGQRPFDMGYKSMFVIKDLIDKKTVPDPIYTGLDVCEPETVATCIAK